MADPNPKDACGKRKPPLRYAPPALLLAVSEVMEVGARKYGPFNWRDSSVNLTTYIEAAQRHLMCLQDGQDFDDETRLHHAAHAAACMGIVLDALSLGKLIDDRFAPGAAAALIADRVARTGASPSGTSGVSGMLRVSEVEKGL
ncbi:MAG: DUF5664 domain-containing protein [Rhodospirillales bacterium]|nr:DUF5664 domain-containing protein [Rhodospirillales bacterium]